MKPTKEIFKDVFGAVCLIALTLLMCKACMGMAEQGAQDNERFAIQAKLDEMDSTDDELYIAPADEVMIELRDGSLNHVSKED